MMVRNRLVALIALISVLCGGCMYPAEKRQQLDKLDQHVAQVQSAVERYQQENKVLPYRYTEEDEKLTTHYQVDFRQLLGYVGQIPPSAFEQGGDFMYVLVNVDQKPTVKLFDLRVNEAVEKVRPYVTGYRQRTGKWPRGQDVQPGYYEIDYQALNMDPVTIPSPYSVGTEVPLLIDEQGRIWADYRMDVMKKWQSAQKKPEPDADLRAWLAESSHFVAGFSPLIHMEKGNPIFVSPNGQR